MIERYGRAVTLRRRTVTPDPAAPHDPSRGSAAETDYPATAVFATENDQFYDGIVVEAGDRKALIAASGIAATPRPGDRLIDGTDELAVVAVRTVQPGLMALIYELLARR